VAIHPDIIGPGFSADFFRCPRYRVQDPYRLLLRCILSFLQTILSCGWGERSIHAEVFTFVMTCILASIKCCSPAPAGLPVCRRPSDRLTAGCGV